MDTVTAVWVVGGFGWLIARLVAIHQDPAQVFHRPRPDVVPVWLASAAAVLGVLLGAAFWPFMLIKRAVKRNRT